MLSVLAFDLRARSLAFHPRDFGFFAEQYRHLLDTPAYDRVALSPNGNDAFGFHGIDGHPTIHHEVHASPIKYPLALLYRATGSLAAVHLALLVLYLVALAYAFRRTEIEGWPPALSLSQLALLSLTPPFVAASTFDLRPFMGIGAFVLALVAALSSRASAPELAIVSVAGLLVREDAAPVLAIAAAYLALDGRPREARGLYALAAVYVAVFHVVYAAFTPFEHGWTPDAVGALGTFAAWPLVEGLARLPVAAATIAQTFARHRTLALGMVGVPFFGAAMLIVLVEGMPAHGFLGSGRWYAPLAIIVLVGLGLVARASLRAQRALASVSALSVLAGLLWTGADLARWHADAERRAGLLALRDRLPADVGIVTDYRHYQAFAARDRVIVWDRFPAHLAASDARDHAADQGWIVRGGVGPDAWIVLHPSREAEVTDDLRAAGIASEWRRCAEGPDWVALRPVDSDVPCVP